MVLEGLDGAGTSTQLKMLDRRMDKEGMPHVATWEPTDGPVGTLLRSILAQDVKLQPTTVARLYAADRNEHVKAPETGIAAMAASGRLVVCDRYIFSSLAYQSIECGYEYVAELNAEFPLPRLLFFLDTPVEVSQARLAGRSKVELFDGISFQKRVRQAYLQAFEKYGKTGMTLCVVDGNRPPEQIHEEIWNIASALPITRV